MILTKNQFLNKQHDSKINNSIQGEGTPSPTTPYNYIYFHHIQKAITIPVDPESIADQMSASWASSTPLSRSAPLYSYQSSGPRSVQFTLNLHRDLIRQLNPDWVKGGKDPVTELIDNLEACVLPDYNESGKIVNPPIVSVKFRQEIYIKGIVRSVSKQFNIPIINYGTATSPNFKYALVTLSIAVEEVTPYMASIIGNKGGYRDHTGW